MNAATNLATPHQIPSYAFPVSLQPVFTTERREIPRLKAVVREDTQEPIATVSDRYKLVTHSSIMDAARGFIGEFGAPQEEYFLGRRGAVMVAQFTYREHTVEVAKGDIVGLRVYIENSYNSQKSVRVMIGALVLSCMNGMVSDKSICDFTFRHVGSEEILFPNPQTVLQIFKSETRYWQHLTRIELGENAEEKTASLFKLAEGRELLTAKQTEKLTTDHFAPESLWDFNQLLTYAATHLTPRLSPIGRLDRLEKISRWVGSVAERGIEDYITEEFERSKETLGATHGRA